MSTSCRWGAAKMPANFAILDETTEGAEPLSAVAAYDLRNSEAKAFADNRGLRRARRAQFREGRLKILPSACVRLQASAIVEKRRAAEKPGAPR